MGLDLSYLAGEDHLQLRMSQVDWQILDILGKTCPEALELVAGVQDFGEPRTERRLDLLRAVESLLEKLERESDSLPYVYCHRIIEGPYADDGGPGITGGIRIGGDDFWYELEGGLGHSILVKRFLGSDGKVHIAEQRDIRELKSLKTDNMGEIKIYRKKKPTQLKQILTQLKEFFASHTEENITKILG
jgi:hypothetical protein